MDQQAITNLEQAKKLEDFKRHVLFKILDKQAIERLARVRIVNPDLAAQADIYLLQVAQSGKLKGVVNDEQLKEVLKYLTPETKKTVIKRV